MKKQAFILLFFLAIVGKTLWSQATVSFTQNSVQCDNCSSVDICYQVDKLTDKGSFLIVYEDTGDPKFIDLDSLDVNASPGTSCVVINVTQNINATNKIKLVSKIDGNVALGSVVEMLINNTEPINSGDVSLSFTESKMVVDSSNYLNTTICYEVSNPNNVVFDASITVNDGGASEFVSLNNNQVNNSTGTYCVDVDIDFNMLNGSATTNTLAFSTMSSGINYGNYATLSLQGVPLPPGKKDAEYLIIGYDNDYGDGFSLRIMVMKDIEEPNISLTNANFSDVTGWEPKNLVDIETIQYRIKRRVEAFSVICLNYNSFIDSIAVNDEFNSHVLIDGDPLKFNEYAIIDDSNDNFLGHESWTNVYLYTGAFNGQNELEGVLHDGITFGITYSNFPWNVPFSNPSTQLFFFKNSVSGHATFDCSRIGNNCDYPTEIKRIDNWITGNMGSTNELSRECGSCDNAPICEEIEIIYTTSRAPANYLLLLDETSSIYNNEWLEIIRLANELIDTIGSLNANNLVACATWARLDDPLVIHNDFLLANQLQINPPKRGGGTFIDESLSKVMDYIDEGFLNPQSNMPLYIIIFTDGPVYSYNASNLIKKAPYQAKISTIYIELNNGIAWGNVHSFATLSSRFGFYNGELKNNPGDPEGQGLPRSMVYFDSLENVTIDSLLYDFGYNQSLTFTNSNLINKITVSEYNGGSILESDLEYTYNIVKDGVFCFQIWYNSNQCYKEICIETETNGQQFGPAVMSDQLVSENEENNTTRTKINQGSFNIYPNPTNGEFTIQFENPLEVESVTFVNINNQIVLPQVFTTELGELKVNTEGFADGIYLVQVQYFDGTHAIKKLVKIN